MIIINIEIMITIISEIMIIIIPKIMIIICYLLYNFKKDDDRLRYLFTMFTK